MTLRNTTSGLETLPDALAVRLRAAKNANVRARRIPGIPKLTQRSLVIECSLKPVPKR
jgi:hypothetical protein